MTNTPIILYINTTDPLITHVEILSGGETKKFSEKRQHASQAILPLIEKALNEEKLELKNVTAVEVHPGPGSFTGVRVGVAVANTLGFMLKIPVNGKSQEVAVYESSKFDI